MRCENQFIKLFSLMMVSLSAVAADERTPEQTLVRDNTAFAVDLYQQLRSTEGNLFFSPYSISTALAMTYAGARADTETQMAEALHFSLGQAALAPASGQLQSRLNEVQKSGNVQLGFANSLWPQKGHPFLKEYLDLTERNYGAAIVPLDFAQGPEQARTRINDWVEKKTQDKIQDLIPSGTLNALTRLVLANAIYFKGNWETQFKPRDTKDAPFYLTADRTVSVPMMTGKKTCSYANLGSLQVLQLPYTGEELSMIVLLPMERDGLGQLEEELSVETLDQWRDALRATKVIVSLPRFEMTSTFRLDQTLQSLGMRDAFDATMANFAGMDGRTNGLYIGAALHKAFVEVNEQGTEAAAATGVAIGVTSMPPSCRVDHPFLFLIQENQTGSILFLGRVTNPSQTQ